MLMHLLKNFARSSSRRSTFPPFALRSADPFIIAPKNPSSESHLPPSSRNVLVPTSSRSQFAVSSTASPAATRTRNDLLILSATYLHTQSFTTTISDGFPFVSSTWLVAIFGVALPFRGSTQPLAGEARVCRCC